VKSSAVAWAKPRVFLAIKVKFSVHNDVLLITINPGLRPGYFLFSSSPLSKLDFKQRGLRMVNYRRYKVVGGCYFFTVVLRDRHSQILTKYIAQFRNAIYQVKKTLPFQINAMVVLPDHLHTIWTLPKSDADFSTRWNRIKGLFTQSVKEQGFLLRKNHRGEYNLWQRRFWEHAIKDELDMANHVNYIHYNPVKHRLVSKVRDWPYSSFHHYVRKEILPLDWCDEQVSEDSEFGE
jgi:putative transposase